MNTTTDLRIDINPPGDENIAGSSGPKVAGRVRTLEINLFFCPQLIMAERLSDGKTGPEQN
jgi:hypothetical protein